MTVLGDFQCDELLELDHTRFRGVVSGREYMIQHLRGAADGDQDTNLSLHRRRKHSMRQGHKRLQVDFDDAPPLIKSSPSAKLLERTTSATFDRMSTDPSSRSTV
jgi:hypothetical protein